MANFMDVHSGFFGVTASSEGGPRARLAIEADEACISSVRGSIRAGQVFCLASGPSRESVIRIHERRAIRRRGLRARRGSVVMSAFGHGRRTPARRDIGMGRRLLSSFGVPLDAQEEAPSCAGRPSARHGRGSAGHGVAWHSARSQAGPGTCSSGSIGTGTWTSFTVTARAPSPTCDGADQRQPDRRQGRGPQRPAARRRGGRHGNVLVGKGAILAWATSSAGTLGPDTVGGSVVAINPLTLYLGNLSVRQRDLHWWRIANAAAAASATSPSRQHDRGNLIIQGWQGGWSASSATVSTGT